MSSPKTVIVSLLRGINVGGNNRIRMEAVRAIYQSIGLENPQTLLQTGNIVYRAGKPDLERIGLKIQAAIEQAHGFRPAVIQRTLSEFRRSVATSPFRLEGMETLDPSKLLVTFLAAEPHPGAGPKLRSAHPGPEQIHLIGRELFIYFPLGIGKSQIPPTLFDKTLRIAGTARNWNTVTKLLELAESAVEE